MTAIQVNDELLGAWKASAHPYKKIAAAMAEWAKTQEKGAELPPESFFSGDLDFVVTSVGPWIRAKHLLHQSGVLKYYEGGPYRVA